MGFCMTWKSRRLRQNIEGEADGIRKVASNLIADGTPTSKISELTNLSVDEVNNLRKAMTI